MEDNNGTYLSLEKPVDALAAAYSEDIRPFIDVIDNLRRFGLQQDISLPNVVVVGDQSSGKSSIIEAISGIELPRGKGIVTRCPLELQLKRVTGQPWKAILSYTTLQSQSESIEISEPHSVEIYIREAQEKMCGTKKGVSRELITLRVESPAETAPDLTLIDLPGIARIAVEGQPYDICDQIHSIIMDHVRNENTVILCVVSANLDAAVNESIKIAKEVDPEGRRTFGVITKPDTADEAQKEEVLCLLNNEKIKLEKGFHMVKCRSQIELEKKLSLEDSLDNEKTFFQTDKYYKTANTTLLGIDKLAFRITNELVHVIQSNLPGLRDKISSSLHDSTEKLVALPQGAPENVQERKMYLNGVVETMRTEINSSLIKGRCSLRDSNLFYTWRKAFNNLRSQMDSIKERAMKKNFTDQKLKEEILKNRGNKISGFLNFELFEALIKGHVVLYKEEADSCIKEIRKDTDSLLQDIIQKYFEHFPTVASNLKEIAHRQLDLATNKTSQKINAIFEEEKLVFTLDSAFEREIDRIKQEEDEKKKTCDKNKHNNGNSSEESLKKNAKRMLTIIECYLKIVHTRLSDLIPMSIRQCMHVELNESLRDNFLRYVMSEGVEAKVIPNQKLIEDRKNLNDKIARLQRARAELSKL